jgi:hypothetical protein
LRNEDTAGIDIHSCFLEYQRECATQAFDVHLNS